MKEHEVWLAIAGRAYLVINDLEYDCLGGRDDDGYRFAEDRYDSWTILTFDQMLNSNYTIRVKDEFKLQNLGAITANEYYINSRGYYFYCVIGSYFMGGFISIINYGVTANFEPNSTFFNRLSLAKAFYKNKAIVKKFSKEEIYYITKEIAETLTPYCYMIINKDIK